MKDRNLKIIRGDDIEISDLGLKLLGDYTSYTIYLTVKETRALTDVRYVDVTTTTAYDGTYTRFSGTIPKENLQGLTFDVMVWDLVKDGDVKGLIGGDVELDHRARSDYDGLAVDETSLQFVTVDTSGFAENDMLIFDGTNLVNIASTSTDIMQFILYGDADFNDTLAIDLNRLAININII